MTEKNVNTNENVNDVNVAESNEAAMKALKDELMASLKDELKAEVRSELEAEAAKRAEAEKPYKETKAEIKKANEPVTIRLFKDSDKYKSDVFVCINGESWLIKRGESVQVPRKVADVLALADDQIGAAADVISEYEEIYNERKDQLT